MVFGPCCCLSLKKGVRIVAIVSMLCGIGVAAISSWILHRSIQARRSPTLTTANQFISQVNTYFGGTTGLYDLDVIFRILISASMSAMIGGGAQFLMSFWLLLASVKASGGQIMAKIWVIIHVVIMLAIGGGCLCILTNELEINVQVKTFLIVTGLDSLALIYFCFVVFAYGHADKYSSENGLNNKMIGGINYVLPPENAPLTGPYSNGTTTTLEYDSRSRSQSRSNSQHNISAGAGGAYDNPNIKLGNIMNTNMRWNSQSSNNLQGTVI